ncbi:MAG: glycyl radical protein [Ruminococcaceae bacterium]|nr:glycyl radical protein [Oscillospiraceae bacterium]
MAKFNSEPVKKSARIDRLLDNYFASVPEIEADRAVLITESYKATENEPMVTRKSKAFEHILKNIPIVIREDELIVGSSSKKSRGCQTFPEFSYEWLEAEFDTVATRTADPFYISKEACEKLAEANKYWKGRTTSELATAYMTQETKKAIAHNLFTVGNYYYNGVGHICVKYDEVLAIGYEGIIAKTEALLKAVKAGDMDCGRKTHFYEAVIRSCKAVIAYAERYAKLAEEMAAKCFDSVRKAELLQIAKNCYNVPRKGATSFYEACQTVWFIQQLLQVESSGHSISPGRFDQYMYPYYKKDIDSGVITREFAQELIDCFWIKLNDINKVRDAASAEGFAGYSLFQNLIVGGQNAAGIDVTNDLSFMCIDAAMHVMLPQPSLSIRVWNGTPHELMMKAATLTRTGVGLPAYYNDEVIIPSLLSRGVALEDARNYCIIGCVEPQAPGKTEGWHDAAFFNMLRPLELVFSNGYEDGELVTIETGDVADMKTFDEFYDAYKAQMNYAIELLVNADNAVDLAHMERGQLPFESCMVDGCLETGKTLQEGGAIYNFTGPQGFGIANVTDALVAIRTLVFEQKVLTLSEFKTALAENFGAGMDEATISKLTQSVAQSVAASGTPITEDLIKSIYDQVKQAAVSPEKKKKYESLLAAIDELPKYGNDIEEIDLFAKDVAYTYTRPMETYKNPRGGMYQAGLYPVSANVPLGAQTGATPDGRLARKPIADGVGPASGRDKLGPTAAANSVARLDHGIASNGTLYNQKFHPSALSSTSALEKFVSYIRGYFDQKGMHVQFNVVSRETLLDAQQNPEKYKSLVVRVAGYSALFTSLSRSLQDDIINRTTQGF